MDQASRLLAPINDATATGKIGVYALAAGVASGSIDLLPTAIVPGNNGRWFVTVLADTDNTYLVLGDSTVAAPNPATTGNLGSGGPDTRCWGPIPKGVEWHREVGAETRYLRAFNAADAMVRVYVSSVGPFGELPG